MAVADCTFGRQGQWRGRGGTESGQERAHGAPLAATLCGQRGGRAVEGRHPPARAQAADGEENQASREPDAQREAAGCHPLERTHDGGAGTNNTSMPAATTSLPMPSPGIAAILYVRTRASAPSGRGYASCEASRPLAKSHHMSKFPGLTKQVAVLRSAARRNDRGAPPLARRPLRSSAPQSQNYKFGGGRRCN